MEMTSDQINSLQEKLLTIKEENLNVQINAPGVLGEEKMGDTVDIANSDMNGKLETLFRARYVEKEKELNRALDKITVGEYGLCEECDGPIAPRRLELNPTALCCVVCQEKIELN